MEDVASPETCFIFRHQLKNPGNDGWQRLSGLCLVKPLDEMWSALCVHYIVSLILSLYFEGIEIPYSEIVKSLIELLGFTFDRLYENKK